jgi:hypothetical protein
MVGARVEPRLLALQCRPFPNRVLAKAGSRIVDSPLPRINAEEVNDIPCASLRAPKRRLAFGFDHYRRAGVSHKASNWLLCWAFLISAVVIATIYNPAFAG